MQMMALIPDKLLFMDALPFLALFNSHEPVELILSIIGSHISRYYCSDQVARWSMDPGKE